MSTRRPEFPLPDPVDERTAGFFTAAARGDLAIPRCEGCGRLVWYPRPRCPHCGATSMPWTTLSGRGELFSWAVVRRAFLPAFEDRVPFVSGLVCVDEDPSVRVVTLVVDCEPATLAVGQPVRAVFRDLAFAPAPGDAVTVPMFVPA